MEDRNHETLETWVDHPTTEVLTDKGSKKVQVTLEKNLYLEAKRKLLDRELSWQSYLRECVIQLIKG